MYKWSTFIIVETKNAVIKINAWEKVQPKKIKIKKCRGLNCQIKSIHHKRSDRDNWFMLILITQQTSKNQEKIQKKKSFGL